MSLQAGTSRTNGPRGHWLLGSLPDLRRNRLKFIEWCAHEYGDFVPLRAGPRRWVLLNHPDYVEELLVTNNQHFCKTSLLTANRRVFGEGLLTSEGDFWRRQRRLAQPAFHRQRVAGYGAIMSRYAQHHVGRWRNGHVLDIHAAMMRLTLAIVAKCLFDADVSSAAGDVGQAMNLLLGIFVNRANRALLIPEWVPTPDNLRVRRGARRLDNIIYGIIRQRRRSGSDPGDLLSILLAARDEDGSQMTDKQVRDEAMTLFLAGHETTALALSWAFYLLALNPLADAELAGELRQVLGGRAPAVEDVPRLQYASHVVAEAMRLYPPAWTIGRDAIDHCEIGGRPVRRGTMLFASPWIIHRDARWFDQPLEFRPSRWADGLADRLPRFAYFPFGGGQRMCIGSGFATMEATLLLASVAQRFRLELVPGQTIEPQPSITLRPRYGIQVRLGARERSPEG
jgi:cytochrome P450